MNLARRSNFILAELSLEAEILRREPLRGGESRAARFTGINALMAAVLEEAIRNYLSGSRVLRAEVELWMGTGRSVSPFSFIAICEQLGLQPDAVRASLRRRVPVRASGQRARGNVRPTRRLL